MQFFRLSIDHIDTIRPLLATHSHRTCDLTVGGLFPWRHFFQTDYAIEKGVLYTRLHDTDGTLYYNLPVGGSLADSLITLRKERAGEPLRFCTIPGDALPVFKAVFPHAGIAEQRNYFDYLYLATDLASLAGKKYSGQRNQISQFKRSVGSYEYVDISDRNRAALLDFFLTVYRPSKTANAIELEENRKAREVLERPDIYRMSGGVLYADGRIVGFSMGEQVGDTVFVHIEKADRSVKGAYQMLVKLFAEHYGKDATYINREDDAGDMGLRTSKLSYHPYKLLEKYTVCVL